MKILTHRTTKIERYIGAVEKNRGFKGKLPQKLLKLI